MYIHNIKEADFSLGTFQQLVFSDSTMTTEELAEALKKVKKCNAITLDSYNLQEIQGTLQHIEGLTYVSINLPHLEIIPDNFFPDTLVNCNFGAKKIEHLPSSIFNNKNLTQLAIGAAATALPNVTFPVLKSLSLYVPQLEDLPASYLPNTLQRLFINPSNLRQLPETLSTCVELSYLYIHAPLQAEMPDLSQMMKLENLLLLNLEMESFTSKHSLPTNLRNLHVVSNRPIKNFPSIAKMSRLGRLHLQGLARIPHGLEDCQSLERLSISAVQSPILPDFSSCQRLSFVSIQNIDLTTFPNFIFNLPYLKYLYVKKTKISAIPENWSKNTVLETLDLGDNGMRITDLSFSYQLTKLKNLNLEGNILLDPYALIATKKVPLANQHQFLAKIKFQAHTRNRYNRNKEPGFLEFCSALGRAKLPMSDKKWFFDMVANISMIEQLPTLDFPQFLKALNINFKPLRSLLERRLIRDVLIQHLSELEIFENPFAFDAVPNLKKGDCLLLGGKMILPKSEIKEMAENLGLEIKYRMSAEVTHVVLGQDAENWKEESEHTDFQIITESALRAYFTQKAPKFLEEAERSGDLSMVKNVVELLENPDDDNILLALELMKGGGVPKLVLEDLLLLSKTSENADIRRSTKALLELHAPPKWLPLLKNRLEFHQHSLLASFKEFRKKMDNLAQQIPADLSIFFMMLLQKRMAEFPEIRRELDECLYVASKKMEIEKVLLQPGAVVFVNGTTRMKKTEIKEKLIAANLAYAQKYSEKVTHVLIGSNPKTWDLDSTRFKILTENHLQTYFSKITPAYLEQAAEAGDSEMSDNLLALLHSPDESNVSIALEMLEGGGVPADLIVPVLVVSKTANDAKIRSKARKLLELYAPTDWLPMIKSKLLFKGITGKVRESALNNKLDKLAKETSYEVAAVLSMGMFEKFGRGLRFMMKKSNRKLYIEAAKLLLDGTHFSFAKGLGFKNWRDYAPEAVILMGTMKTGVNFPDSILELGKIESIDFHNCKLTAMPKNIAKFQDVKELDFSHNSIKKLPINIHKMKKLEILNLKMNCFEGFPVRLATIKSLKKVDLSHNRTADEVKLFLPESVKAALPNCEFIL